MNDKEIAELDYSIIYISGKRAKEPGDHHAVYQQLAEGKGWISAPNCHFPQKIILKLFAKSLIRKIQILAHHECIRKANFVSVVSYGHISVIFSAKKIDFFVCDEKVNSEFPEKSDFEKLGVVEFRDNQTTDYNARELKTIFLEAEACFLKLLVYENHWNKRNPDSQVGIMGLEIGGSSLEKPTVSAGLSKPRVSLIQMDKKRRVSLNATPQRIGTAQARKLMEKNYAQELHKLQKMFTNKLNAAEGTEKRDLDKILRKLNQVHDAAIVLLKQGTEALGESDQQLAEACEEQIKRDCNAAYDELKICDILSAKELKEVGLERPHRAAQRPPRPSSSRRSRSDTGASRTSKKGTTTRKGGTEAHSSERSRSQSKSMKTKHK